MLGQAAKYLPIESKSIMKSLGTSDIKLESWNWGQEVLEILKSIDPHES